MTKCIGIDLSDLAEQVDSNFEWKSYFTGKAGQF